MKWGKHYLQSLQRAHELQQCNNFKDPGVQFYGTTPSLPPPLSPAPCTLHLRRSSLP